MPVVVTTVTTVSTLLAVLKLTTNTAGCPSDAVGLLMLIVGQIGIV